MFKIETIAAGIFVKNRKTHNNTQTHTYITSTYTQTQHDFLLNPYNVIKLFQLRNIFEELKIKNYNLKDCKEN